MGLPQQELLRSIPSVDVLLQTVSRSGPGAAMPRAVVVEAIRAATAAARDLRPISTRPVNMDADRSASMILADVGRRIEAALGPHYRKAINATGIILHTALGRAVLPARALRQIAEELSGYSLSAGRRGRPAARSRRDERIEELLRQLTGAEAATVVNNNAAATAIVLNTVAAGKEVIVSRGQLVEIGGSFRLPEVMAAAGAKLVEVGTTNKTHLRDYEQAITAEHGRHPPRASEQLQDRGLYRRGAAGGPGAAGPGPRPAGHRRRRRRRADRLFPLRLREGADAAPSRSPPGPTWSPPAPTR